MKIKPSCDDRLKSVSVALTKIIFLNFIPLVRLTMNSAIHYHMGIKLDPQQIVSLSLSCFIGTC